MSDKLAEGEPLYVTTSACASVLGLHRRTPWAWVKRGWLRGITCQVGPHDSSEAPRKTNRGRILIELASLEEAFARMYQGESVPPALLRRLRSLARPLPGKSP